MCSPEPADLRRELAAWIEQLLEAGEAVWYRWGGAELHEADCSGLVVYWARAMGLDCPRWTTADMLTWPALEGEPEPGDLALYPGHVTILLPGGRVAGMSGGRRGMTVAEAQAAGARLRAFDTHLYRPDFWRWARIPWEA